MADSHVDEQLWNEFHTLVNMTSRELTDWLRTDAAGERTESLPDESGHDPGHRVAHILAKRRADLTPDDVVTMEEVVAEIRRSRGEDLDPTAGDAAWRHRLMSLGHDPLKPTGEKTV